MKVENFVRILESDFYTGVPDSQLKAFCNYLIDTYGVDAKHHVIAANEGNCTALAAGYYLATGKIPVVYLQNSGEGNMINPVASLLNDQVYAIPAIFVIGWRGEPGIHDEPQHSYQGKVTIKLLDDMDILSYVVSTDTTEEELKTKRKEFYRVLEKGKSVAFVIRKGALTYENQVVYKNPYLMNREEVIWHIAKVVERNPILSTTGKISRELFEIREKHNICHERNHESDFLTVGSMGHCSSIALGIAVQKPETKLWCIDGDGAVLMHMGAMAVIGACKPQNMVHIILNNESHETVGGMPTVAEKIDFVQIAKGCGYPYAVCVRTFQELDCELEAAKRRNQLSMIEVKCAIGARSDLGRPTTTTLENKQNFMKYLSNV